jgi:hypothetical protein
MNQPVLLVGIGCVIAAVVGGGLSLANLKVPIVNSIPRQLLLGVTGFVLVGGSFLLPGPSGGGGGGGHPGESAEITLSDGSAPRGATLTVSGSGFSSAELVELRVHITTVGTVTADSNGRFTQKVTVPESAPPPGFPTSVSATGHSSSKTATAPFTVAGKTGGGPGGSSTDCLSDTSTPEITLSRATVPRGASITVSGSGFCAGELVEIRVHVTSVGTATADGKGGFTQQVTVPPSAPPPGFPTNVSATGRSSSKTATAPFSTS